MPEHIRADLPHLQFRSLPETMDYHGSGRGVSPVYERDRDQHVKTLRKAFSKIEAKFGAVKDAREQEGLSQDFGLILNVESEPDYPLAFISLERAPSKKKKGLVVLNVRREETKLGVVTKAAVFVPYGRLDVLAKKLEAYGDHEKDGKPDKEGVRHPANEKLIANISKISVAALEALWTDPDPLPTDTQWYWWEVWIRRHDGDWESTFREQCVSMGIEVPAEMPGMRLVLPDHVVLVIHATREQLEGSLDLLNTLSEVRKARPCSAGLTDLPGVEQEDWVNEALSRIVWPPAESPAVTLIDTGINRGHPLLEPLASDNDTYTVLPDGDRSDSRNHGTPMAGLAAFGDLRALLLNTQTWNQEHKLESVKILSQGKEHDPENYGAVTLQAINLPEISAADRARVFSLAITCGTPKDDGRPSSWSAAIDAACSGSQESPSPKRLVMVSAGNVRDFNASYRYPETLHAAAIEDPAQAWNSVAVGACSSKVNIEEEDDESRRCRALAPEGDLSPFSRTSHSWRSHWPIKPDVVMEGGNLALSQNQEYEYRDSLQLLSTSAQFRMRPIVPMHATSAATALAARVSAQILTKYPGMWPETVRGLVVHSARWTDAMLEHGVVDPHRAGSQDHVEKLLRSYGFGEVNESRAIASASNNVTIYTQSEIQPYTGDPGEAKLNECHLFALPWPKDLLEQELDSSVIMRVTLSYFIEPNPGSRSWEKNLKYHYASCLLRFRPKHKDQPIEEFRNQVAAASSGSDDHTRPLIDPGWALGAQLRGKSGSLVQDVWKGSASQLAEMGHIGVFPVKGWWATRKFPSEHEHYNCHEKSVRYSLIVSLESEENLPIYTSVENAIDSIEVSEVFRENEIEL